jgi:hypothetical protein
MGLKDYQVDNDHFVAGEEGAELWFPCCACKHKTKTAEMFPCRECGHNANAVKPVRFMGLGLEKEAGHAG